jgi:hypothetical protein
LFHILHLVDFFMAFAKWEKWRNPLSLMLEVDLNAYDGF